MWNHMKAKIRENSRILIVDDTEDNVALLETFLADSGYTSVMSTSDPREVIRLYMEYKPDIVLLDLNMPYLDGFEIMEMLREVEHDSYIPVLVLTAEKNPEIRIQALEAGARDFLTKPFDVLEVESRIKNQLEVRLLHNQAKDQNRLLEERVRYKTKELRKSQKEVIKRLGMAAEYRDNETGFHILRMSKVCKKIALNLGLGKERAELIQLASQMHDIGKIGIPDGILLKPEKLNGDEWRIMKTHTTIGEKILRGSDSELLEFARKIALTHHERWDGSGYPDGLKGEDIPIEGRIASISDVFDALLSVRPYKKAWTVDETLAEISQSSGKQFDPELVDILNNIVHDILAIRDAYKDST